MGQARVTYQDRSAGKAMQEAALDERGTSNQLVEPSPNQVRSARLLDVQPGPRAALAAGSAKASAKASKEARTKLPAPLGVFDDAIKAPKRRSIMSNLWRGGGVQSAPLVSRLPMEPESGRMASDEGTSTAVGATSDAVGVGTPLGAEKELYPSRGMNAEAGPSGKIVAGGSKRLLGDASPAWSPAALPRPRPRS